MRSAAAAMIQQKLGQRKGGVISGNQFVREDANASNIKKHITRLQLDRLSHDIGMWREAIKEMELAYNPFRVRAIRMYIDTVVNIYVKSVLERWTELTTQREPYVYQKKGGEVVISKDLTEQLQNQHWYKDYIKYTLEAMPWGYSLISLGDIVDDKFPHISSIRRENIRPDGYNGVPVLTSMPYVLDGIRIDDSENKLVPLFNHFISTPPNRGVTNCGYGFLYEVALAEIHLRHIMEWNMDFIENHAQPIKVGSTVKRGDDRNEFEAFLADSASSSWILLDTGDNIDYKMAESAGTSWKSYENMEQRLEDKIAQLMLGHTDAMKSTPGKLGGMQAANKDGNNENLIESALGAKQNIAGDFVTRKLNENAGKFRQLGRHVGSKTIAGLIPEGYSVGLENDREEKSIKRDRNSHLIFASQFVKNLNEAGWDIDKAELEGITGLTLTAATPEQKLIQERTTKTLNEDGTK